MSQECYKALNLTPPEEAFELYRYKNAEAMTTRRWSGLYWARKNEAGAYEIRAVTKGRGGVLLPWGSVLERSLREALRESRLVSAATTSMRVPKCKTIRVELSRLADQRRHRAGGIGESLREMGCRSGHPDSHLGSRVQDLLT
jgi:hypothetical protein